MVRLEPRFCSTWRLACPLLRPGRALTPVLMVLQMELEASVGAIYSLVAKGGEIRYDGCHPTAQSTA